MKPCRSHILPACFLALAALLQVIAFYPAMEGEFIADDANLIQEKADLFGDPGKLGRAFSEPYWVRTRESLPFYRPLVLISFFADRALWDFEPFGYHLTNLLLHLANGLLVYFLGLALTRSRWVALAAALLFGLHPVHLTSVAWISGRTDLLAVLFLLPAAALFIRGSRGEQGGWGRIALSGLCFFIALLAKEVSLVLLPFTLIWLIGEGRWRSGWRRWAPLVGVSAVYLLMRWGAGSLSVEMPGPVAPLIQRLLTMPALLLYYLKLFFWPAGWNFAPLVPPVESAADWRLWTGLFAAAAVGTAVALLWKRNRPAAYGALFGLLALLPVSGLVPLYASAREWWAYTASAGLALALAPLPVWLAGLPRPAWGRKAVAALLVLPLLAAAWSLHRRSEVFSTADRFWHEAVERAPYWDVGWNYLGLALQAGGKSEEAMRCFSEALELRPDVADYANNLGLAHVLQGRADEAERLFRLSLRLDPGYEDPCHNLGMLLASQGRLDEAEPYFREALRLEPNNIRTLNSLATLYIRRKEPGKAVELVRRSLALDPGQAVADRLRAFLNTRGEGAGAMPRNP